MILQKFFVLPPHPPDASRAQLTTTTTTHKRGDLEFLACEREKYFGNNKKKI
jgi:hypothetical protein